MISACPNGRYKKIIALLLCMLLIMLPFHSVSAAKKYKNQLVMTNQKLYYYNAKGKKIRKKWKTIDGNTYYFSANGAAVKGLKTIKKKRYLFDNNCILQKNSPVIYKNKTYYPDKNGVLREPIGTLKNKLNSQLKKYSGTWSVYVKNLNTNESFSIRNQKMYAASEIKLFALATAYDQISKNKFSEASVYKSLLVPMITVSDNTAFNQIVRKVGNQSIDQWCQANGYTNTQQRTGSIYGSYYSGTESPKGGKNLTCVEDLGKLLESIYHKTCVNEISSEKMLKLLKAQERRTKIPAGIPRSVTVANKTGETDDYTHDCAIVYSNGATYILCVMAHCPGNAWSSAKNITSISKTVYQFFN